MAATTKSVGRKRPILEGKIAVVFGAGGLIGSAVAKELAAEEAEVYLSGRNKSSAEAVAEEIVATGRPGTRGSN